MIFQHHIEFFWEVYLQYPKLHSLDFLYPYRLDPDMYYWVNRLNPYLVDKKIHLNDYEGNLILVNFWATWCGPCRAIAPVIEELHTELEGKAVIGKVNVDENSDTPVTYGVRNIPTLLVFKNGEVVDKVVGNQPKAKLIEVLEAHM